MLFFKGQCHEIFGHEYSVTRVVTFLTLLTQYQKFVTNIPRKGIAGGQSQFPDSCVGERFIYTQDRSAYSAAGKYVESIVGIYKSHTDT
jgi:hypothetical protein